MGEDKATLCFKGRSLKTIALDALAPHYTSLFELGPGGIEDAPDFKGPMRGIMAALHHCPQARWLILACDMPLVDATALAWLLKQSEHEHLAVIPRTSDGQLHPTCALYTPQAAPALSPLASPIELATHPRVHTPLVPTQLESAWTNVNDRETWKRLVSRGA